MRGSCRFQALHARASTNRVGFNLSAGDGEAIRGEVVINVVAYNGLATAYAVIELADST